VFQPHLYSRTRDFLTDFVSALAQADRVIVMDIYAAREKPIPGVEASDIVRLLKESGYEQAIFTPHRDDIAHTLRKKLGDNEVILCMGAGDITDMIPRLLERLGHE